LIKKAQAAMNGLCLRFNLRDATLRFKETAFDTNMLTSNAVPLRS